MPAWRLVSFSLEAPEDADFVDYEDKELLLKHFEDMLENSHIILVTQLPEEVKKLEKTQDPDIRGEEGF